MTSCTRLTILMYLLARVIAFINYYPYYYQYDARQTRLRKSEMHNAQRKKLKNAI